MGNNVNSAETENKLVSFKLSGGPFTGHRTWLHTEFGLEQRLNLWPISPFLPRCVRGIFQIHFLLQQQQKGKE